MRINEEKKRAGESVKRRNLASLVCLPMRHPDKPAVCSCTIHFTDRKNDSLTEPSIMTMHIHPHREARERETEKEKG